MVRAAEIFQNGMVIQRNKPVTIWGTGMSGEKVEAEIQGKSGCVIVDAAGKWQLVLPALSSSEEESLVIRSGQEVITYENVAVGEVWVAGGQSNMEFHIRYEKHKAEEILNCTNPRIRFFDVPEVCFKGQEEVFDYSRMGLWRQATPDDLEYFSAVGYYFQKDLEQCLDVPVGIVGCNWGGTRSCAWMNPKTVEEVGKPWLKAYEERIAGMDMADYWKKQKANPMNDRGNPFADPFGELALPRTASVKELEQFFKTSGAEMQKYAEELHPVEIPGILYECMLKSIAPYAIRGFLWYQGESDDVPGFQGLYKDMLKGLIGDWRALWQDEKLPFLIVQLPGWKGWLLSEAIDYPTIRRCQEIVANTTENVYLCSISDAGERNDIHPKNKKVVGQRLALLARGHVYGEQILCDAPAAKDIKRDGQRLILSFANAQGGLHVKGERIEALRVTSLNEDIPFTAEVDGEQVIIHLQEQQEGALKVELAQTAWYLINLYNKAGIPAIPFSLRC